jgi:polysaccharide deacetylase family protein (PEP-CTERM system associated)
MGGGAMSDVVNAFSVDVEDYFQVAALAPAISPGSWDERESRVERNTDRILHLLADRGVRGTFFVLGWIAERHASLIQRIRAAGHEIASHGYSHRLIYRQSPAEFRAETERCKHFLEDLIGHAVIGYRGASFSITRQSLWALDVLIDLGFQYDSSIFPIRHDRYGIPDASAEPGPVVAPSGRSLIEFPLAAASFGPLKIPVSGGGYFRLLPYGVTHLGLNRINQAGRPVPFYLHPWELDPEQPRVRVGALSRWRHYTNLHRCEGRLQRLLTDFKFDTLEAVLRSQGLLPAKAAGPAWMTA